MWTDINTVPVKAWNGMERCRASTFRFKQIADISFFPNTHWLRTTKFCDIFPADAQQQQGHVWDLHFHTRLPQGKDPSAWGRQGVVVQNSPHSTPPLHQQRQLANNVTSGNYTATLLLYLCYAWVNVNSMPTKKDRMGRLCRLNRRAFTQQGKVAGPCCDASAGSTAV